VSHSAPEHHSRTAVVVVTYGAHHLLEENLATIGLGALDIDVIVVDNFHSATERTAVAATALAHQWELVQLDTNVGFGAAVNVGVARAKCRGADTVMILNPDASADATTVAQLVEASRAEPRSLLAPRILRPDGSAWFRGGVVDMRTGRVRHGAPDHEAPPSWLTGACLTISIELFEAVGGFDPDYFLYLEDVDLSWRCAAAGARLVLRDDLVAVHAVGATQVGSGKSALYYYFNCRNRLLLATKHLSRQDLARWVWFTPMISWEILRRGGGRRQLLHSPGLVWAGVRGTVRGIAMACVALLRPPVARAAR
jgi:GT2 family glycosyltransferase